MIGSLEVGYDLLPNFEIKTRGGYTTTAMNSTNRVPLSSLPPSTQSYSRNTTVFSNSSFRNWIIEPQANWKPRLGHGKFDILAGMQFLNQVTDGLVQTGAGFTSEALMKNITSAPT